MKNILKITVLVFLVAAFASCKKEEALNVQQPLGLGGDTWTKGAIDKWLFDSITKPYNIEVKYRWDPWEVQLDRTLVPPDESKVVPAMSAIKQIWIDPYNAETGSEVFIKKYSPKSFVLVGSPQYNYNGTILLGQAEGGNKIAMYVINDFDKNNITELRRMLHTIEHEFAHILHQTIMYPLEFKSITPAYTSTWFNISEEEAHSQGFATAYSMSGPDEDFVEMVSTMLVEGKERFDELVTAQNATAQAALRRKEEIVVSYFRDAWNIDFYSLQKRTQDALNLIAPPQPVPFYFGYDKIYTTAEYNGDDNSFLPVQPGFSAIYNNVKASLQAAGDTLDQVELKLISATRSVLIVSYHNASGDDEANFTFNTTKDANNVYDFTYASADANGTAIKARVQPLLDYFANNNFSLGWYLNPNKTIYPRAVFTPQQTANASFTALLF
jgi:substrate import-associated zinc metallohydrolase lipoprotein